MDITTDLWDCRNIAFYGNQTIIIVSGYSKILRTYDVVRGTQLSEGNLPLEANKLLIHWVPGESLLFATSFETDEGIVINIQDLQPTSNPPFPVVESFLVPSRGGVFSFSPVSFHTSFLTNKEVIVLDVRDTKTLLHVETPARFERFSPDGRFFAYATWEYGICVWKNTSTGYIPWSTLKPQFASDGLAFSPTATSVLSWSIMEGIQLLDNHLRPPPPDKIRHHGYAAEGHLVAYSADGTHIATARYDSGLVTIHGPLSDTPQFINTNMRIRDIKIFDNTIFVVDEHELVDWNLEVGYDTHGIRRTTLRGMRDVCADLGVMRFALSNDCSEVAVITVDTIILYNITIQRITKKVEAPQTYVWDVRFSPNGNQLWFIAGRHPSREYRPLYHATLHMMGHWRCEDVTKEPLEDGWSQDSCFPPPRYHIRIGSRWIEDFEGSKLFWLPPNWRTVNTAEARWNGNFLALVGGRHPEPLIIEFQPRPVLSHPPTIHSSYIPLFEIIGT